MYSRPKYLGIRYEVGHDVEIIVEKYTIPKLHGPKKGQFEFPVRKTRCLFTGSLIFQFSSHCKNDRRNGWGSRGQKQRIYVQIDDQVVSAAMQCFCL